MTTEISTQERIISVTSVATKNVPAETWTIEGKKFVSRKPAGFTTGHSDDLACSHRDCSVCPTCEATYANIVEVSGEWYWVRDYAEWFELVTELCRISAEYA